LAWLVLVAVTLTLFGSGPASIAEDEARDLSGFFPGFRAALVLHDVNGGRGVRHDRSLAATRFSPCSTFKIPNSLIGLETGVVPDASFTLKWDGQPWPVEAWNRDHDLRSAMRDSVVWYYQELARRVGPERMQRWVAALRYGNQDISGGIDRFWLGSSLRISPDEQVEFLGRLFTGELPVSARSLAILKDVLLQDSPAPGLVYRGKTGSCPGEGADEPHGWWVGSVEKDGHLYVFAALIQGPDASGRACRPMAERALAALGVLPPR
jgi:beta-lactamase class D